MSKIDSETRMREKPYVTKEDIKKGLEEVGLGRGDIVVVHSSLSAFGYVKGGADTVIDALLEVVGEEGTVVMPTFHNGKLYRPPKDPMTTPSELGLISNVFCHRKGVIRGIDCNFAAKGPKAQEIVNYAPLPPGRPKNNPLYKIAELGGYILLLGVGQSRNSTLHVAQALAIEEIDGIAIDIYESGGGYEFLPFDNKILDDPLIERGKMRIVTIGEAEVRLIESRGLFQVIRELYQESSALRDHTKEYLKKRADSRLEVFQNIQNLTEEDIQDWKKVELQLQTVQRFRYTLMEVSEKITALDRNTLAKYIKEGDLRLFADQLEGKLLIDFEETMKVLRNHEFTRIITYYLYNNFLKMH
jgi:aminoglycoside N3'-acetyltransferase